MLLLFRTDEDRYPTHYSKYGKGGIKCVRTIAERDDIPLERLEVPTLCYVLDDDLFYIWDGSKWNVKEMGNTEIGLQRNVRIVNDLDNKNISASKGEPCYLKFTFISQNDIVRKTRMKIQESVDFVRSQYVTPTMRNMW